MPRLNGTGWTPSPFPHTIEIASLYPNPTNSSVSLVYRLLSQGNVTGSITDVLGRRVQSFEFGYFPVGEYMQDLSLNRITSGQYIITIRSGNQSDNRSFIVVR
ncbi:MAG: T9SS type A sorting domain-containing protein [bacterium]|nr:T9SS type A sorting domain-containing protein [bacterium]